MSYQNDDNNRNRQRYPAADRPDTGYQGRRFRQDVNLSRAYDVNNATPERRQYPANNDVRRQQYPDTDEQTRLYRPASDSMRQRQQVPQNYVPRQQQPPQNYAPRQQAPQNYAPRQQAQQNYAPRQRQQQVPQNYDFRQRQQAQQNYSQSRRQQIPDNFDRYEDYGRRQPSANARRQQYDRERALEERRRQQYADGYDSRSRQRRSDDRRDRADYDDNFSGNKRRKKKKRSTADKVILSVRIVAILLLLTGIFLIGKKLYGYWADSRAHSKLQQMVANNSLEEYQKLHEINSEFFGWLEINDTKDTKIDYPVMYTPDNPEKYLHLNFYEDYSDSGELFLDANCDPNGCHFLIYGHHMFNGDMFGSLPKYEDGDFLDDHNIVNFDTCYEKGEYKIFAVFRSKIYDEDDDVFKYYNYANLNDEATYNYYVENVKDLSIHDIDITPQYPQKIVTLSTCNYHTDDGRFIVCAVKIS